jgi:tRNA(fMet)-specific endonuclease VapC
MYLLDTNVLSDLFRHPRGAVRKRIGYAGADNVAMSVVTAGELLFGAEKKRSPRMQAFVEEMLRLITVIDIDIAVSRRYAILRTELERSGTPIGMNDLWIAAHALASGMTLVSANEREFARVPGLKVENWLAA